MHTYTHTHTHIYTQEITNLDGLHPLENLWLGKNKITKIQNLDNLTSLKILGEKYLDTPMYAYVYVYIYIYIYILIHGRMYMLVLGKNSVDTYI